jgi:hypothetical protein
LRCLMRKKPWRGGRVTSKILYENLLVFLRQTPKGVDRLIIRKMQLEKNRLTMRRMDMVSEMRLCDRELCSDKFITK